MNMDAVFIIVSYLIIMRFHLIVLPDSCIVQTQCACQTRWIRTVAVVLFFQPERGFLKGLWSSQYIRRKKIREDGAICSCLRTGLMRSYLLAFGFLQLSKYFFLLASFSISFMVLGNQTQVLHMVGKLFTTELRPQTHYFYFNLSKVSVLQQHVFGVDSNMTSSKAHFLKSSNDNMCANIWVSRPHQFTQKINLHTIELYCLSSLLCCSQ